MADQSTDLTNNALEAHKRLGGKIHIEGNAELTPESLAIFYTPGVAEVSRHLAKNPQDARLYTSPTRAVAVVSDGSAVLGLGNVGPQAALPVMEGKAMLFRDLAGVDAWPIVLSTQDPDQIVAAIKAIAPGFGGINLEDIAAPQCFEIERRLQDELSIPVVHDDQHATAIVTLAGIINALIVVKKDIQNCRVVINGAGAAGTAIATLLQAAGAKDIVVLDSKGIISRQREDLNAEKLKLAELLQTDRVGGLDEAVEKADILIGVSVGDAFSKQHIQAMAERPIVLAMANPIPEIMPEEALQAGAQVVATGRSDFPNQINNVLVFPGLFKGLIASGKTKLELLDELRIARALAAVVKNPSSTEIIPSVFNPLVVDAVCQASSVR